MLFILMHLALYNRLLHFLSEGRLLVLMSSTPYFYMFWMYEYAVSECIMGGKGCQIHRKAKTAFGLPAGIRFLLSRSHLQS